MPSALFPHSLFSAQQPEQSRSVKTLSQILSVLCHKLPNSSLSHSESLKWSTRLCMIQPLYSLCLSDLISSHSQSPSTPASTGLVLKIHSCLRAFALALSPGILQVSVQCKASLISCLYKKETTSTLVCFFPHAQHYLTTFT